LLQYLEIDILVPALSFLQIASNPLESFALSLLRAPHMLARKKEAGFHQQDFCMRNLLVTLFVWDMAYVHR
jgi:hypothetical protein